MQSASPSTSVHSATATHKRSFMSKIKAAWARGNQPANGHLHFGVYCDNGRVTVPKAF